MNIKLCVSHRLDVESYIISTGIIMPVLCGEDYAKAPLKIQGDNQGENISKKRNMLGEFTVEYWMWKNIKADYYGLCHYRRYFAFLDKNYDRNTDNHIFALFLNKKAVKKYALDDDEGIRNICSQYEMVVPQPTDVTKIIAADINIKFHTVKELWEYKYCKELPYNMIETFIKSLEQQNFPLVNDLKEYLETQYHIGYNCFIVKKDIFNEMCQLIFNTISKLEIEYDGIIDYSKHPRTLEYLCEIMFGVFIYNAKKQKKYKELPLVFFNETRNNISIISMIQDQLYNYFKIIKKILSKKCYKMIQKYRYDRRNNMKILFFYNKC